MDDPPVKILRLYRDRRSAGLCACCGNVGFTMGATFQDEADNAYGLVSTDGLCRACIEVVHPCAFEPPEWEKPE